MGTPIGVFIISEHRLFREAVAASLSNQQEIALFGSGIDAEKALPKMDTPPDVVLIDATSGKHYVIDSTTRIKQELPDVKVVVLGVAQNANTVLDFIENGANGYALKQSSLAELRETIIAVNNEEMPCSPEMVASLFLRLNELSREHRSQKAQVVPTKLTQRELEILRLVAADLGNKEIAHRLNLSLSTVKNHVHSILKKLQLRSRGGAIRYVEAQEHVNLTRARL